MAKVDFGNGAIVELDDATLADPKAVAQIAHAVKYQHGADETSGANWQARSAMAGVETDADRLSALKQHYADAAKVGDEFYVKDAQGRSIRADEKGFSAKDLIDIAPMAGEALGSLGGAILGGGAGLPTGPGAIATGMAGSAAGAVAGKETSRAALRWLGGSEDTRSTGDRLRDAGETALWGAAGEGVGQVLGQGVKLARNALTPGAESQAIGAVADAIGLPASASTVADSRLARAAEDFAGRSRLGHPTMERASAAQNQALGRELDAMTDAQNGWRTGGGLAGRADVVEQAGKVSRELPVGQPLGLGANGWADQYNALAAGTAEDRRQFARTALQQLGGDAPDSFSAGAFLSNWQKADPRMKHALGNVEGVGKELNALLPVVRRVADLEKRTGKPLETPIGSVMGLLGMGGGYAAGGVLGAAGAALAPALVGKLLTNPKFVNWVARVPRNPGSMTRHLGRLSVMAQDDPDVRAFAGALGRGN